MPEVEDTSIIIFDVESEQPIGPGGRPIQTRGVGDFIRKIIGRSVPTEQVQQNITRFLSSVQRMLAESADVAGSFTVDMVEVDAQISAEGKVGFMGSNVGISGSAGIKFVLKRRP